MPRLPDAIYEQMAILYKRGPAELQGNWQAAAHAAGFKRVPGKRNERIVAAFEKVGAAIPMEEEDIEEWLADAAKEQEKEVLDLPELPDSDDPAAWKAVWRRVEPYYRKIASGQQPGTPAQVQLLKEISLRAHGKPGAKREEEKEAGVLVLPALGSRRGMKVCPVCKSGLEEKGPA
jgi:hypothetical protein